MPKSVICNYCPCLNNDADYGKSCNLGYKIDAGAFGASSDNCGLKQIEYIDNGKTETFKPEEE